MIEKKLIRKVAKKLDDKFEFKGVIEFVDGIVFRAILNIINSKFLDALSEPAIRVISEFLEAFVNDSFDELSEDFYNDLNELIDIPLLNDENEDRLFRASLGFIRTMLKP